MILYSVTVSLDADIYDDWKFWMIEHHIPAVMNTGFFSQYHISRLLEPSPEPGMVTVNIQYECDSLEAYEQYRERYAPALQQEHTERYKNRFVAFRTLLQREN